MNLIGETVLKLESGNEKCGLTDGQTDVGHINLIGGLVTRNPPKNFKLFIDIEGIVPIIQWGQHLLKIVPSLTVFEINNIFQYSEKSKFFRSPRESNSNSNSNSTFIALNLRQKTDSKAHHTKTLFNIQKPETLQGSAPRRKQKGDWKFRVGMLFQRGMTSTLT